MTDKTVLFEMDVLVLVKQSKSYIN